MPTQPVSKLPSHNQLLFPLLETLQENGGKMSPKDAQKALAEKLGIPEEIQSYRTNVPGAGEINLLARRIRWTRQTAVSKGLIKAATPRNIWELCESTQDKLRNAKPGIVITIYETPNGKAIWAQAEAALGTIEQQSVQLILTSPPYPLVRKKEYQKEDTQDYLNWITNLAAGWREKLTPDGSLLLNLSDCWNKKEPTLNLYQERLLLQLVDQLGYNLIQRLYWHSPSKIPSSHWVTVKKYRLNNSVEHLFWLSKSTEPKTRVDRVLKPYGASMLRSLAAGGDRRTQRPSTHGGTQNGFGKDRGGSTPFTLQNWTHATSQGDYFAFCRDQDIPLHPARFPKELPEFCVKFLTDPKDTVYDPFGGSNTTGAICEELDRKWITSERSLTYLHGSLGRFIPKT